MEMIRKFWKIYWGLIMNFLFATLVLIILLKFIFLTIENLKTM